MSRENKRHEEMERWVFGGDGVLVAVGVGGVVRRVGKRCVSLKEEC